MKKILLILSAVLLTATNWAQSPEKMSYQAVVRNNAGQLVTNTQVGMQISILQGTSDGTVVYSEVQTPTTNANGLVSIEIGGETGFQTIDWSDGPYFIKTETDPEGGTNYTISGTSQLLSVPYALHAKNAENITGIINETDPVFLSWDKNYNDLTNSPDLSVYATKNMGNEIITNLADPINGQDAATKAYVDALLARIVALEASEPILLANGFTDSRDGNHYKAVKIGNQIWMAENLKYLPSVVGPGTGSQTDSYYYVYGYDGTVVADAKASSNYQTYGVLYNWPAAMQACPAGWHLPTDMEWKQLEMYLGMSQSEADKTNWRGTNEGGKLKETGTTHWISPNTGATNESGFSARPGGDRRGGGSFGYAGIYGDLWSATESSSSSAWHRLLYYNDGTVYRNLHFKDYGFSVRCFRDN